MYVCLCAQVTDAEWNAALDRAALEGKGWREASVDTGAGLGCGGCRLFLAQAAAARVALPVLPLQDALPAS